MRITVLAVGSRGDVQPYVALALGLQQAGHAVRLASHEGFRKLAEARGLAFAPVGANPKALLEGEAGQAWLTSGRNPLAFARAMYRLLEPEMERLVADCWAVCQGADAVVYSPLGLPAYHIAEKLGMPSVAAALQPLTPTRAFPSVLMATGRPLGGTLNLLTHLLGEQLLWQPYRRWVNRWRQETLGLPPVPLLGPAHGFSRKRHLVLYGFSPVVVPKPEDWGDRIHVTGYWFLNRPEGWQPPRDLADFLAAGPPPISIGFGSMAVRDAARTTEMALEALKRVGLRGVLLTGWGGLEERQRSDQVFFVREVPHDWLFPRVAAVVHHGGAGTTAAALRAGVPAVIIPFFGDQPFWGHRVADLGAGPPPIIRRQLTVERLTTALRVVVSDEAIKRRAAALGERIRGEDGVQQAVAAFHARVGGRPALA